MCRTLRICSVLVWLIGIPAIGQSPRDFVRQAVASELEASRNDHSHWLYFEADIQPSKAVKQWVAEAKWVSLNRVIERDGRKLSASEQRREMTEFIGDSHAQNKRRRSGQHDEQQAAEMLQMLPEAFIWTYQGENGPQALFHFKPDPQFHAPDLEARVFASMEGEMEVDRAQHRIARLKGRLIHDVKIGYGLLGELKAGGTFDVERRELSPHVWEIVQTHVHIVGHALIFKTISENEDDVKSHFKRIDDSTSLEQAQVELLQLSPDPENGLVSSRMH